jgi:hypothetical protein
VIADAPELLRRAAERLEYEAQNIELKTAGGSSSVRIIRDQEHESTMRELLLGAKERCLVVSNKLGAKASIRLAPLNSEQPHPCKCIRIQYSKSTSGAPDLTTITNILNPLHGKLNKLSSRHSKIVLVDDTVLISSYNFLSADPFGTFTSAKEIGVLIKGGKMLDILWEAHTSPSY